MVQSNILFSLLPMNSAAMEVVRLECNQHLVSEHGGQQVLDVGHIRSEHCDDNVCYIATMGRAGDIVLPSHWASVSKVHCAFLSGEGEEGDPCITFVDKSKNASCQAYGGEGVTRKLLSRHSRQADTVYGLRSIEIRIDRCESSNTAQFGIVWHCLAGGMTSALQAWCAAALPRRPNRAGTEEWFWTDGSSTPEQPSSPTTDAQTNTDDVSRFVLAHETLGFGAFGTVVKAIDQLSKEVVAVKVQQAQNPRQQQAFDRELLILKDLRHPNIVQSLGSRTRGPLSPMYIFMKLEDGNLEDLINTGGRPVQFSDEKIANAVYRDILKGLDYIHWKGYIHRDVKPANILYTLRDGNFSFRLADFGLSNSQAAAKTACGTPQYAAPELFNSPEITTAVDMWSLLLTILWTLNLENYRDQEFISYGDNLRRVIAIGSQRWECLIPVQELFAIDYRKRATAAQMLLKHYGGDGMTTDIGEVAELQLVERPEAAEVPIKATAEERRPPKQVPFVRNAAAGPLRGPVPNHVPFFRTPAPGLCIGPAQNHELPGAGAAPVVLGGPAQNRRPFAGKIVAIKTLKIHGVKRKPLFGNPAQPCGERKPVPKGDDAEGHPVRHGAREETAGKRPDTPKTRLASLGPTAAGVRKSKPAVPLVRRPLAGPKVESWLEKVLNTPGAFPKSFESLSS